MQTAAVTPIPHPALPDPATHGLGALAAQDLVRLTMSGTQTAEWKEGPLLHRTRYRAQRERTVESTIGSVPYVPADRAGRRVDSSDPVRNFAFAGRSLDAALEAAHQLMDGSIEASQVIGVVQAADGAYFTTPLGFVNSGSEGDWLITTTAPVTRPSKDLFALYREDETQNGPWRVESGTPERVPGRFALRTDAGAHLAAIAPLHDAVKAVMTNDGWYDLRAGAVSAAER